MKTLIVVALVGVILALAAAGRAMLRKGRHPGEVDTRMARALAWRIGLSIAIFVAVLVAWRAGWITPTGLPTGP